MEEEVFDGACGTAFPVIPHAKDGEAQRTARLFSFLSLLFSFFFRFEACKMQICAIYRMGAGDAGKKG